MKTSDFSAIRTFVPNDISRLSSTNTKALWNSVPDLFRQDSEVSGLSRHHCELYICADRIDEVMAKSYLTAFVFLDVIHFLIYVKVIFQFISSDVCKEVLNLVPDLHLWRYQKCLVLWSLFFSQTSEKLNEYTVDLKYYIFQFMKTLFWWVLCWLGWEYSEKQNI